MRAETIERFSAAFAPAGFRRRAFIPCYGMAESTLFVTGIAQGEEPVRCRAPTRWSRPEGSRRWSAAVSRRRARGSSSSIRRTRRPLPDGAVGEIWISGGSVAAGYHNRAAATEESFRARLADTGEGPFLRTGDLGFLRDRQLFITGRLKNLIIVRGRNHHPEDLEATAQRSQPAAGEKRRRGARRRRRASAAIAIIHELTREGWRGADADSIVADIREAIAAEHGLQVSRVLLIKPGSLPRTTSGKVRRAECGALLHSGGFETLPVQALQ